MTLVWAQGSVQGIMTGQTSMVARGQVSETFTLVTKTGTVRCALPLGTYCRLSAHLLNKWVTVSGMVGSEANGQPRKVVDVEAVEEHEGGCEPLAGRKRAQKVKGCAGGLAARSGS